MRTTKQLTELEHGDQIVLPFRLRHVDPTRTVQPGTVVEVFDTGSHGPRTLRVVAPSGALRTCQVDPAWAFEVVG